MSVTLLQTGAARSFGFGAAGVPLKMPSSLGDNEQVMPATIPVLPATDIEQGAQLYGRLGFVEDGRAPDYQDIT
jgi:hypothetical protein